MRYLKKSVYFTLLAILLYHPEIYGQPGRQNFISPEVREDGTVTFLEVKS